MNIQDIMKVQLMTNASHNKTYDIFMQILLMIFVGIMDDLCKMIPVVVNWTREQFTNRVKNAITDSLPLVDGSADQIRNRAVLLDERHNINSIRMMRIYKQVKGGTSQSNGTDTDPTEMNNMVDAVFARVSHLHNVPSMCLIPNGHFMISYKEKPLQISDEIFMKIEDIKHDAETGNISVIVLVLLSNTLSASDISKFVLKLYHAYQEELKNALGDNIYYFDHKIKENMPPRLPPANMSQTEVESYRRMRVQTASKQMMFTMTPFYSNKRWGNVFGNNVRYIQKRVEFFVKHREWYDRKGIPYQLGIMLSGTPGTGKTSIIRAIANMTKRHIINVNFANITTATQLKNLFYNDKITVYTDAQMTETRSYFIPIDQRLYVFEEVDAAGGDLLKQRSEVNTTTSGDTTNVAIQDELTLADVLTIFDGTMEIPGRMFIMTSNHPEVLDRALLRPGRIDINVKFGCANRELIAEMCEAYLEVPFPKERLFELPDGVLTPAEISDIVMKFCKTDFDMNDVIEDIKKAKHTEDQEHATNIDYGVEVQRNDEVISISDITNLSSSSDEEEPESKSEEISTPINQPKRFIMDNTHEEIDNILTSKLSLSPDNDELRNIERGILELLKMYRRGLIENEGNLLDVLRYASKAPKETFQKHVECYKLVNNADPILRTFPDTMKVALEKLAKNSKKIIQYDNDMNLTYMSTYVANFVEIIHILTRLETKVTDTDIHKQIRNTGDILNMLRIMEPLYTEEERWDKEPGGTAGDGFVHPCNHFAASTYSTL